MSRINVLVLGWVAMCSVVTAETMNIASEVSYPPWNDTKDEHYEGYEVDLFPLICEKAGLQCEFNGQQFSTIISSVRFKKYDVVMSGMGITQNRKRVLNFSRPYGLLPTVFVTKKGSSLSFCQSCPSKFDLNNASQEKALFTSIKSDLSGKKVGVQKGSLHHIFFTEHKEMKNVVDLVLTETQEQLVDMLEKGQIDMQLTSKTYAVDVMNKKDRQIQIVGPDVTGGMMGDGVGIGIRKEDKELKARLDKAIGELEADGTLSKLTTKWFGFDMFPK